MRYCPTGYTDGPPERGSGWGATAMAQEAALRRCPPLGACTDLGSRVLKPQGLGDRPASRPAGASSSGNPTTPWIPKGNPSSTLCDSSELTESLGEPQRAPLAYCLSRLHHHHGRQRSGDAARQALQQLPPSALLRAALPEGRLAGTQGGVPGAGEPAGGWRAGVAGVKAGVKAVQLKQEIQSPPWPA